jgi:CheY-like chemotaxis protein
MIMNLVVNARDAMPEGGKLTIETADISFDTEYAARHVGVTPGEYVRLSISDTGCGMDSEVLKRLFEPFFTTKGQGKGTGLGLSTVYGIVTQSGGHVEVDSQPGNGSVFNVYLPRPINTGLSAPRRTVTPDRPAFGSETILLVEDEEMVRNVTERMLRAAGYRVLTAANGSEAMSACEGHPGEIHLLLTDVIMPQMSGRQLAEQLHGLRPGLRVLYMSGYTDDAIVHHGVLDPGTKFIAKPFNATDLTRKVRDTLDSEFPPSPWSSNSNPPNAAG